jgi:predicted ATP-binding protein involved in virulence
MRVKTLSIRNFRGIERIELTFPAAPTSVLVGINGAGKSSILDCMAIMLSRLIGRIRTSSGTGRFFTEQDIRHDAAETRNSISVDVQGRTIRWTVTRARQGRKKQTITNIDELKKVVSLFTPEAGLHPGTNLPLAVYYHVNRAVLDIPLRIRGQHEFDQLAAYDQALTGARNDFRVFFEWFRRREDIENEGLRDVADEGGGVLRESSRSFGSDRQLNAVRTAIERMLPGFVRPRVRRQPLLRMTVEKSGQELVVNQLSDGEKCLLAMAGDLARRLAIANPSLPNPLDGEGVVMIDEVDLHLHPQWQRLIISALEHTFKGCQFILTTHSPLVLSYVPREQVILLEDFKLVEKVPHTYGRDANSLLFDVMAVVDRPDEIKRRLEECFRLIDEEEMARACEELAQLEALLGKDDPEIVRARSMLAFLEGP